MLFLPVNIWAVIVSAVVSMALGFLWYSPIMFGKAWMKLSKVDPQKVKQANKNMPKLYSIMFVATLVTVYVLAQLIDLTLASTTLDGVELAALVWAGFVAATGVSMMLFEGKSWKLFFINTGFTLVSLLLSGVILTLWI